MAERPDSADEVDDDGSADDESPDADVRRWLTKNEAIEFLQVTARSFSRREQAGDFRTYNRPGLGKRYDRLELERLTTDTNTTLQMARLLATARDMLETANRHNKELFQTIVGPQKVWQEAVTAENAGLRAQVSELRTKYESALDTIERARSELLERELAATKAAKSEERKDQAWKLSMKLLPKLGEQIAGTHRIAKFVRELGDDEVNALLDPEVGFLTKEQSEILADAIKRFRTADKMSTDVSDKKAANGKATDDVVMPRGGGGEGAAPAS